MTWRSFDSAVMTWGIFVENELNNPKRQYTLKEMLGLQEKSPYPGMNAAAWEFLNMLQPGALGHGIQDEVDSQP